MPRRIFGLPKKELNPDLWELDRLKSNVRNKLLLIAEKFYETLEIDAEIIDIKFGGSSADYTLNNKSDIDLHIILDFEKIQGDNKTIRAFVNSKKANFNNDYDIKIYGVEVELYVEDKNDDNKSDAIYSLIDNVWIKKPKYREIPYINRKKIDLYISSFVNAIDNLSNTEDPLTKYHEAIKLKNRIKQIRQTGLSSSKGNFSEENLVFKTLRATNKIKKLREEMVDSMEQILSIIEPKENK